MKKHLKDIIIILIFVLFLTVSYVYTPSSVKMLHKKIEQTNPLNLNKDRLNLIAEYNARLYRGLPTSVPKLYFYWHSNQRKLSDLRIKEAIEEIKNSQIEPGKIRVWSLLNMGVVIKTDQHTIAIDTANLPFSQAHNNLVNITDIFITSHDDGDHFDPSLLKKALKENKKVVLLDGLVINSPKPENVINLKSGNTQNINGVEITAYQTDHRGDGNFNEPSALYVIKVDGFKLLHTGDGRDFKNKDEEERVYGMKDFDILLVNIMIHPYNIRDLKPKMLIPLHLYKFMSGKDLYQQSTIETAKEIYNQYETDLQKIEKVYLLPGESVIYPF